MVSGWDSGYYLRRAPCEAGWVRLAGEVVKVRRLAPNQTLDPARGSFLVDCRMVKELPSGDRIFAAPVPVDAYGNIAEEYSNTIHFIPVREDSRHFVQEDRRLAA